MVGKEGTIFKNYNFFEHPVIIIFKLKNLVASVIGGKLVPHRVQFKPFGIDFWLLGVIFGPLGVDIRNVGVDF